MSELDELRREVTILRRRQDEDSRRLFQVEYGKLKGPSLTLVGTDEGECSIRCVLFPPDPFSGDGQPQPAQIRITKDGAGFELLASPDGATDQLGAELWAQDIAVTPPTPGDWSGTTYGFSNIYTGDAELVCLRGLILFSRGLLLPSTAEGSIDSGRDFTIDATGGTLTLATAPQDEIVVIHAIRRPPA